MTGHLHADHETEIAGPAVRALARLAGKLFVVAACLYLFGCGTFPDRNMTAAEPDSRMNSAALVVQTAKGQVGAPYRYGGSTPRGFDCSGLVQYAYRRAGIEVPRTTAGLLRRAQRVSLSNLHPGDVLFFRIAPPKISHVGLYVGNGRFVHAPSSGKSVSYASLSDTYWSHHIVSAGRFIE